MDTLMKSVVSTSSEGPGEAASGGSGGGAEGSDDPLATLSGLRAAQVAVDVTGSAMPAQGQTVLPVGAQSPQDFRLAVSRMMSRELERCSRKGHDGERGDHDEQVTSHIRVKEDAWMKIRQVAESQ